MNYHQNSFPKQSFYQPDNRVQLQPPWWVKIATNEPKCVYYFGSFVSKENAIDALPGYVEDLEQEQAKGIFIEIKRDNPQQLTQCKS
ncbi:MAG: DUF1816 domain-containing protein [Cyanobacteria bacterium J06598_4]